jgi:hypothetical protein
VPKGFVRSAILAATINEFNFSMSTFHSVQDCSCWVHWVATVPVGNAEFASSIEQLWTEDAPQNLRDSAMVHGLVVALGTGSCVSPTQTSLL